MKLKYIIGAVAAITAVSCQKSDNEPDFNLDPNAVRIEATVGSIFTRSNPLEEGAASAVFKSGDVVTVAADAQAAVGYTFNGTSWSIEAGKYLRWDTPTMTFKAWYPQSASMTDFTLPTDQSTPAGIESADYMTFEGEKTRDGINPISLTLARKTARVVISTSFNDQYATGYTVENITVNGNTTGYQSGSTKTGTVMVGSYKQEGKFYALLSPTTVDATATFLTITVKKSADGTTETLTVNGIPALAAATSYAYTVSVGKNTVKLGNLTVTDWATGDVIPGGEAETTIEVNPNTNSIAVLKEGALKSNHITAALAGGTVLNVKGKLSAADITLLTTATTLTAINLSEVTYDGSTVPAADWSGCANLTKIIVDRPQATAYETAWSAASAKLLYLGKELTYKVDAMTDGYAGGIPCVVIGITGTNSYRLISRNPYCGDIESGVDEIYLQQGGKAIGLRYNSMTTVISPWGGEVATLADMEALVPLRPNSFTIITKEENGDQDIELTSDYTDFIVYSDGAQYVTQYTWDKDTKEFTLGYLYNSPDVFNNYKYAFFTFDVTTP